MLILILRQTGEQLELNEYIIAAIIPSTSCRESALDLTSDYSIMPIKVLMPQTLSANMNELDLP